jgi:hypothetical protein
VLSASSVAENGKGKKSEQLTAGVIARLIMSGDESVIGAELSDVRLLLERDGEPLGVHAAQMRQATDLLRHQTETIRKKKKMKVQFNSRTTVRK